MDLIQEVRGYSDCREEEEFDEEVAAATAEEQEDEDNIITIPREETSCRLEEEDGEALKYNLISERKQEQLDLLDLSLGRMNKNKNNDDATNSSSISSNNNNNNNDVVEKEHMFEKVVTPSDVGKLNRLVIPKQHAEKYFPLDSSSNEKGLLLNFEDMNNGKLWRFRYSYWNSSQSYVMTKGWSRFVKDKKLHSGDIVSFKRGVGDLYRHRLYIDWKRRSDNHHNHNHNLLHDPSQTTTIISSPFFLPNHYSIPWGSNGSRFYSFPSSNNAVTTPTMINYHHQQQQQQQLLQYHQQHYDGCCSGIRSSTPFMSMHQIGDEQSLKERGMNIVAPMIIDSVPVTYHHHGYHQDPQNGAIGSSNSGKMLRLFGVNMECSSSSPNEDSTHVTKANSLSPSTRGRTTSLLFDLDPSLQYRK